MEQEIKDFLSTRTEVFNIEPIGIATPYVECLSSYISRLAAAHNIKVSILLKKIIAPHLYIDYIKNELSLGSTTGSANYINEIGMISLEYVNALEAVTGRNDILNLTMLNWKGIFSKNLRSKFRRWCPICFEEWKLASKEIYEPLIWTLNDIQKCGIHEIQLKTSCPYCERKLPYLHSRYRTGYCQYCESWLGSLEKINNDSISEEEAHIISGYKQLIENSPKLSYFPSKFFVSNLLENVIKQLGFSSVHKLADYLEFSSTTVLEWINKVYLPSSKSLFIIARKLNADLYELIYTTPIPAFDIDIDVEGFNSKRKRKSKIEIEKILNAELRSSVPKSLFMIAKENNFIVDTAQYNFPEICKEIKGRYLTYLAQMKSEKRIEIRSLLNRYLSMEIPISLVQLSDVSQISKKMLRKNAPDLCEKLVKRYKAYSSELRVIRIAKIVAEIEVAATTLHNQGFYPSIGKIQRELGNKSIFLEEEIRQGWREVVISLGYKVD
ncbi:TniQ family protein [Lysinibacillus fusiformis]|uniref:TniQ family protein n=1 Tax=Lysinibacillus fusiformis TaxID=28031 RepID=UPI003AB061A1